MTATADVTVRPAEAADLAAVGRITEAAYRADALLDLDGGEEYAALLRAADRRRDEATLLVAELDGVVVGSVTLAPSGTEWADVARPGEIEVRMLTVAAEARRRGVAEALMAAAEDEARRTGHPAVVLSTMREMVNAHRLYERLGYQRQPDRDWDIATTMLVYTKPV